MLGEYLGLSGTMAGGDGGLLGAMQSATHWLPLAGGGLIGVFLVWMVLRRR
jgi:hypothetical protein